MKTRKNGKKEKLLIFIILIIMILLVSFMTNLKTKSIETSINELSNKKIEWGIKKNKNHEQPEFGEKNRKLLSENNGICLGNKDEKNIYLTFDMGYEAGYTSHILDSLKENNVKATFFIAGHYLNSATDLVKRMIDEGHIVGNHTVNHKSMPNLTDEEIKNELMTLHQSVYEKFEYEMKYLRPPCGEFSERTLSVTKMLEYKTVMWSFAYVDWIEDKQPTREKALETIINNLHNGEIMLLHATSKTNSEIMNDMITKVREQGYEFKSLDEFK